MAGNKKYSRKPFGGPRGTFSIYTWSPSDDDKKKVKRHRKRNWCIAVAGSTGKNSIDNVTTYVYEKVNIDDIIQKLAYVACNYVK